MCINYSFGECEVYNSQATVCNGALRLRFDNVYISNRLGHTQRSISELLNDKIESVGDIIAAHDENCVEQVYRVICHYYLPPCGNTTQYLPPSSLCQLECAYVEENCRETWQAAQVVFTDPPFIVCEDTSQLLFPLPHCCTGAGIEVIRAIGGGGDSGGIGGGAVAGIVIVIVILIVVVAVGSVAGFIFRKYARKNKVKRMEKMQLDIMAK